LTNFSKSVPSTNYDKPFDLFFGKNRTRNFRRGKRKKKEQRKMRILSRRKFFSRLMKKQTLVKKNKGRTHTDKNKEHI